MKKYIDNKIELLALLLIISLMSSCNSMENAPTNKFTDDTYWTSAEKAQYVVNMAYSQMYSATKMWSDESLSDNMIDGRSITDQRSIRKGQATPTLNLFANEWSDLYGGIKTCHIFLEKVGLVPNMDQEVKKRMIAEIRYIRAAIYFRLTNFYGAIPFFARDITLQEANTISRTPHATVVNFLLSELDDVVADLPSKADLAEADRGKITKAAAIMLKARVYLMESDWKGVIACCEKLINQQGEYGSYSLYPSYSGLFDEKNEYNDEVIMDRSYVQTLVTWGEMADMAPLSAGARLCDRAPQQSLVDTYRMLNGKRIEETGSGYNPSYPYANRDPRMTATIVYDGYKWSDNVNDGSTGKIIQIDPATASSTTDAYQYGSNKSATGYYTRKYFSPQAEGDLNSGLNIITMRYADVLLMYAEAKFEEGQMNASVWNRTIRPIRERAGFTDEAALAYPNAGNDEMRRIIRDERRCELALEGLRWYDIKRWKAGSEYLSGYVYGATFKDVGTIRVDNRKFDEQKDYLWAVPQSQINLNPNLAPNNPGYAN